MTSAAMNARAESAPFPLWSEHSEQSVLGAILLDNTAYDQVADLIVEEDFFVHDHQQLFRAMSRMLQANEPVDVVSVAEHFERAGHSDKLVNLGYIGELAQGTPSAANARRYAEVVRDRARMRRLSTANAEIAAMLAAPKGLDADDMIERAETLVFGVAEGGKAAGGFRDLRELVPIVVEQVDAMYHRDNVDDILGVPTGFTDLDRQTSGLNPGDLIIVGARPSMGKTSFALNIAEHVALRANLPVAFFSLEMPAETLASRLLASVGRINHFMMRKGRMRDEDWKRLTDAARIVEAPIHVDDAGAISPTEVRARCRRLHRQYGKLGLVVVDYLQLMGVAGLGDTRAGEIGVASRALKALAKELNCPIIALSQINRGVESRPNKRPNLSDLRESGDIEQDADLIVFLYRDEVYNPDTPDKGQAEAIIAKQRNGPIGTVRLAWIGELMRFENFAGDSRL
jgi:replicative DNA helicase